MSTNVGNCTALSSKISRGSFVIRAYLFMSIGKIKSLTFLNTFYRKSQAIGNLYCLCSHVALYTVLNHEGWRHPLPLLGLPGCRIQLASIQVCGLLSWIGAAFSPTELGSFYIPGVLSLTGSSVKRFPKLRFRLWWSFPIRNHELCSSLRCFA